MTASAVDDGAFLMQSFEVEKTPYFDVAMTLECGQVFRFVKIEDGYRVMAKDHIALVHDKSDRYVIECDDPDYFKRYFDFETDYALVQSKFKDKVFVESAIEFGRGIHILRQDPVETIFSFLISQNNHIPRIKGIIEKICSAIGEDKGGYHAFPTLESLAAQDEKFFAECGAGYRANYLCRVAKSLTHENMEEWKKLGTDELRQKLMSLHGVGRKVADCILLFGFSRFDVFPVDTWIKKVFSEELPDMSADKMSVLLVQKYGQYSGFVQQWLFYYKREKKV